MEKINEVANLTDCIDNDIPFEIIFEDKLQELTKYLTPLLLFASLHGVDNFALSNAFHSPKKILNNNNNNMNSREMVKFVQLRYQLAADIFEKTGYHLGLAAIPNLNDGYDRIWILSKNNKNIKKENDNE